MKLSDLHYYQGQFNINRLLRVESRGTGQPESVRIKRSREDNTDGEDMHRQREKLAEKKVKRKHIISDINKFDPIMLEPVKKDAFIFIRPNGTRVAFNIGSLMS